MGLFDYLAGLFATADESEDTPLGGGDSADLPADFGQVAAAFAADHADRDFDFTVASLERLDTFVAAELAAESVSDPPEAGGPEPPDDPALSLGSYFGEVLVRQFDGEWVARERLNVVVPAGSTNVAVPPFDAARVALRDGPQFAQTADSLRERVGDGRDDPGFELAIDSDDETGSTAGSHDDPAAEQTARTEPSGGDADAESAFPPVDLDDEPSLDTAHERTLEVFRDAGYRVTAGDLLNSMPDNPVDGVGKLFLFYSEREMYTGVVYVGDWTESDTQAVVSLARYLRADEELDGLHVVSAVEPPSAVSYLTSTHAGAAVTLDAMADLVGTPQLSADSASEFADLGAELMARHAELHVDRTDTGTLARLDEFVLDVLRPVADHHVSHEGYVPREALLPIGALAGEVIRNGLERELPVRVEWGTDTEISSIGVVLQVTTADTDGTLTVNPVGKTLKLYRSGDSETLAGLYETCVQVVESELGDTQI